jgi:hypothetical protein
MRTLGDRAGKGTGEPEGENRAKVSYMVFTTTSSFVVYLRTLSVTHRMFKG